MAINKPNAVAIKPSAIPPVMAVGAPSSSPPIILKVFIMPVTVPNSPNKGAAVIMVSRIGRPRLNRFSSTALALLMAWPIERLALARAKPRTRATKSVEELATWMAAGWLPLSTKEKIFSTCSGFWRRFSETMNRERSRETTAATMAERSSGHMMGPPWMKVRMIEFLFP